MTAANHLLAGSLVAVIVKQPAIALPLAFLSHYALDAVPHFGYPDAKTYAAYFSHKLSYVMQVADFLGIALLIWAVRDSSLLLFACAALALLPDIEWVIRFLWRKFAGDKLPPTKTIKFHYAVQQFERPWGMAVEVTFFVAGFGVLLHYLL